MAMALYILSMYVDEPLSLTPRNNPFLQLEWQMVLCL